MRILSSRTLFLFPFGTSASFGRALARRSGHQASLALARSLQASLAPARAASGGKKAVGSDAADGEPLELAFAAPGGKGGQPRERGGSPGKGRAARRAAVRILKAAGKAVLYAHLVFILTTSLLVCVYAGTDPSCTVLMAYRKYQSGYALRRPIPVRYASIGKRRRDILIRVEDWTFMSHHGFELAAIKNAARINKEIGRPMYGGSTLSMQTARTLFLVPFKSYFRKYLEAIVTVELELFLSKQRILELYYSYAEWGKGIFGIQAASYAYFGAPVTRISDENYIKLVSLLSSPLRYTPETLTRNSLLAWRYQFLVNRFLKPAEEAAPSAEAAAGTTANPAMPAASPAPAPAP
jgi:monofunctional biosynthetic peptidoglycan transglycosylase